MIAFMCVFSIAMAALMPVLAVYGRPLSRMGRIAFVVLAILSSCFCSISLALLAILAVARVVVGGER